MPNSTKKFKEQTPALPPTSFYTLQEIMEQSVNDNVPGFYYWIKKLLMHSLVVFFLLGIILWISLKVIG